MVQHLLNPRALTIPPPITRHYFEDKKENREITVLCRRYLEVLNKVVKDFCEDNE
jgi:hypothetical protein